MMGYSLGEYVAACVAGVFTLEDALYLVARRAALISDLPEGAMTAVPLPREKVGAWLGERLSVAAVNGPELTILAGEIAAVVEVERSLAESGIPYRRLPATHAFHSVMMEPIRAEFARLVTEVRRQPPQIPYITNVTGTWVTDVEATDPEHWADHLCRTVQFSAGAGLLTRGAESAILELGPGQSLSAAIRQLPDCPPDQRAFVLPTLPGVLQKGDGHRILLEALGRLWLAGVPVKWPGLHEAKIRRRISLPTYPFKRRRHWFEASSGPAPKLSSEKRTDLGDWFWIPGWRTTACLDIAQGSSLPTTGDWLLLADETGVGEHLATALRAAGRGVVTLWQRHRGGRLGKNEFELGTAGKGALRSFLERFPAGFDRVVHLWSLDAPRFSLHRPVAEILEMGYFSVLDLLQATARQSWNDFDLWVVAEGTSQVRGDEELNPGLAPLQALVRTANQEMPGLQARLVDLEPGAGEVEERASLLLRELAQKADHPWVAWRGQQRWVESVEKVSWSASELAQGTTSAASDGWIWIVGGLGSIGLQLAEELAAQGVPLMLTRRSPFPPRELWEEKLQVPGEDQARIRRLLGCEKRGTPVRVAAADAGDEVAMERVLREGEAAWGRLRGVLHTAAYLREDGFAAVADLDPHQSKLHFAPKIDGTLALARVLMGRNPDFVVLFSSISSLLAGPGLAAYSAANAFQDAFARSLSNPEARRWLSVNWDTWESPGSPLPGGLGSETAQFSMRPQEGIEVFRRLLRRSAGPQVVVSVGDLDDRLCRWVLDPARRRSPAKSLRGGGALHREYAAPTTEMERAITRIWQEILGVERVGIHDNFFELGGQSLLAAQFFALLRQTARIPADLPLKSLFDAPTPSELAELLGRLGRLAEASAESLEGAVVGIVEGEL
jgi:acyl transferase domain-containing protein